MKFMLICLYLTTFNVFAVAYTQTAKVSVNLKNSTMEEVFKVIEEQTNYKFLYHDELINNGKSIDLNIKDQPVAKVLDYIFDGTDNTYTLLENNLVVISPRTKPFQQELIATGKVTDAAGSGLPGVSVLLKGTRTGTTTDINGNFSLSVPSADAILVFSMVGYQQQEITAGNNTVINISLAEDIESLNEVVVIGYGSVKKRELTGSVASVKEDDFNKGVASDAIQLVQGKVAGLAITKVDGGDPTKGFEISLRGSTSIKAKQDPLIVIDGIPGGDLNSIAPDDIESIDVLKDGSAAAIYGTRGTNGVILVTTKKGKKGSVQVEYASRYFTEATLRKIEVLNRDEYLEMRDRFANSGNSKKETIAEGMIDYGANTDWYDEITRTPFSQNQYLALSGGGDNNSYRLSFDYLTLEGILLNSSKQEYKLGYNMQQQALNDKLVFNVQLGLSNYKSHPVDYNAVRQVIQHNPTEPVRNSDGSLFEIIGAWQYDNPVGILTERTRDDGGSRLFGNIGADFKITENLKISAVGGLQVSRELNGYYQPSYSYPEESINRQGYANRSARGTFTRTFESTIEYKKQVGQHFFDFIGGYSFQDYIEEGFSAGNANFITDDVLYNNLKLGTYLTDDNKTADMDSYKRKSVLAAFFARGAYNYKSKYFLSASLRREGSTKFGENYRWGTFPAVSAAWDLSQEAFLKDVSVINFLKLRVGYGVTGNEGIANNEGTPMFYVPLIMYDYQSDFYYNGAFTKGYGPVSNPNPDLRWETKSEYNFGLDWQALNSRLGGSIDYYIRETKDLIEQYDVPTPPNLYPATWANVGTMSTNGIEFTINATPIKRDKFSWDMTFLFDYHRNKVKSLSNDYYKLESQIIGEIGAPGVTANTHIYEAGKPIGNIYGLVYESIDSAGKWVFRDYNEKADTAGGEPVDGKITNDDRAIIGNGVPKYYLGLTNTFRYGGFDLTVMVRGLFGFQIINAKRIWHDNPNFLPRNVMTTAMDTELDDVPQFSSYYVEDGDFVKIDNITLGYIFNFKQTKYFRSIRAYATCSNAFLITNYSGVDPEVSFKGLEPGNDNRFDYPSTRTYILGINVKF